MTQKTPTPPDQVAKWRTRTQLVRGGTLRSEYGETSEAMFLTSGFVYERAEIAEARFTGEEDGYTYTRLANPTVSMFEDRMAVLGNAPVARATATGMAAVNASLLSMLKCGDHVVAARALFGSCRYIVDEILPRFGITVELVDGTDLDQWAAALSKPTQAVFLETPSNPTLEIIDLAAVAEMGHAAGAKIIVDNVFATPILQNPRDYGVDIVVYSATKHIDGQGRCMGGVILCDEDYFEDHLNNFLRHTGPCMSPFNAWTLLKGLETLDMRVAQMSQNAQKIADFLEGNKAIARMIYPGSASHPQHELAMKQMNGSGSTLVTFDIPGGKAEAFAVMNRLNIIDISNNLGDAKSLITHPATTTHQRLAPEERAKLGIGEATMRLSVGLEDALDLIEDLEQALAPA